MIIIATDPTTPAYSQSTCSLGLLLWMTMPETKLKYYYDETIKKKYRMSKFRFLTNVIYKKLDVLKSFFDNMEPHSFSFSEVTINNIEN